MGVLYNSHFPAFGWAKGMIRFFTSEIELEMTLQNYSCEMPCYLCLKYMVPALHMKCIVKYEVLIKSHS